MFRRACLLSVSLAFLATPALGVDWLSWKEGQALAAEQGRPIMLFFDIDDENGKWFVERVLTGEPVDPFRDKFVAVRVRQSSGDLWKKYGVDSGPRVIFVGPDGEVLCPGWWRAAGALAGSMEEALRKHGPIMPPKVKLEAEQLRKTIATAMAKNDYPAALVAAGKLAELTTIDPYGVVVKVTRDDLSTRARGALERAAKLEKTGDFLACKRAYVAIRDSFPGLYEAASAAKVLARYAKDPTISASIEQAEKEEAAAGALGAANALYDETPHLGLAAWDEIVKSWPDTSSGVKAKELAARCRKDPKAMQAVRESAAAVVCPKWLSLARSYQSAGAREKARSYLMRVLKEHPDTSFAEQAEKQLRSLR